jgi:putative ABC transport system permease protein
VLRLALRSVAAHKARLALSTMSVVIGVAFITGTLIFSDTINTGFLRAFTGSTPDVTINPRLAFTPEVEDLALAGDTPTLPAATLTTVAAVPGVAAANGDITLTDATVVDARNAAIGPTNGAPTLARNWYPSPHTPALAAGRPPARPGEILVDATSAAHHHMQLGDPLRVITPTAALPVTVVGITREDGPNPGVATVYLDTATAQNQLLAKPGRFTAVTVDATPGTTDTALRQRLRTTLGTGYTIAVKEEQAQSSAAQISAVLGVVTDALLGFAAIAVLVGAFLIFNTFAMLVAGRTRELGLLRALGASRTQVTLLVLAEGLVLGVVGATGGLAAGIGLAALLKQLISNFGVDLSGVALVIDPTTPAIGYAVGIGVTVIAAYLPARRAAGIAPMTALREASAPAVPSLRRRTAIGTVLLAVAVAALTAAATVSADLPTTAALLAAGVVVSLLAAVVLAPVAARVVAHLLGAAYPVLFGTVGRLSLRNTLRNPRRTGATAAALMIGLSLVGATTVLAASLTTSINAETQATFGADYVISGNGQAPVSTDIIDKARAVPGIGAVTRQRYALAHVDGFQIAVSGVDTATLDRAVKPQYIAGSTTALTHGGIAVDQTTATTNHWTVGTPLHLTFANGTAATLTISAITKPPTGGGTDGGVYQVALDTLTRFVPTAPTTTVYLNTTPTADKTAVAARLEQLLGAYPQVRLQNQADYAQRLRQQVDTVLYLIDGLLALAITIAVLGVINTLALSVIERTREIGLLRALGMSRPQIRRLIRLESVLIAVHGALPGLGLGLAWGAAAQQALIAYGITALTIPWATIGGVLIGAVLIGLVAAVLPARRAVRLDVLTAIKAE